MTVGRRPLRSWLLRRLLGADFVWRVTTHEGFYSPCDDEWHCSEVRAKIRQEFGESELSGHAQKR